MATGPLALLVTLALALVAGCGGGGDGDASGRRAGERLSVVATTGMVADVAGNVAGDRAEVVTLMAPGVDPHLYRPTRSDIERLRAADVVFYSGLMLEGKMTDALIGAATSGKPVHAVTELLDEEDLLEPESFEGAYDPHVWMDPEAWSGTARVIGERLAEVDPGGADGYRARAEEYAAEIDELSAYAGRVLGTVPERSRVLVTAHDAFNYFGRRFGFEVVGIQGISTESEAGVRDIEALVDLIVEREVKAVFVESTVSERNVRALVTGAEARGHAVTIGGELFSDAMGPAGTYEGTYVGMIDHNVTAIARALGGEAPEGGMGGRLGGGDSVR